MENRRNDNTDKNKVGEKIRMKMEKQQQQEKQRLVFASGQ